jgi:hypothetical protein
VRIIQEKMDGQNHIIARETQKRRPKDAQPAGTKKNRRELVLLVGGW